MLAAAAAAVVVVAVVVATGDLAARTHRRVQFPAWQVGEEVVVGMVGRADELSEEAIPDLVVTEVVIVDDTRTHIIPLARTHTRKHT